MRFTWFALCSLLVFAGCRAKPTPVAVPAPSNATTAGSSDAGDDGSFPITAGKYTILDIFTDNQDHSVAKSNAEDVITTHPDIKCMVGLWAYNPPTILAAVRGADKAGEIAVVGFDEDENTLQGIADGDIHGTIVQQPFVFGYKSVEYLAALARGQEVDVPASKKIIVPILVVKEDNVEEFQVKVDNMRNGAGEPPAHDRDDYDTSEPVNIAFVTNSVDPFWVLAQRGCELAAPKFNATCQVLMPPMGTVAEQKSYIEDLIASKCQGLAISPIDPANQTAMINQACEAMPTIAQDSDAPDSNRLFYLGTSNYLAGRKAGELVKEAIPDGGKVAIFVGKMEVLNAQERSQGVIDELLGKPMPDELAQ